MPRRATIAAALAVLTVLATLTGCSRRETMSLAVFTPDGTPHLIVVPCPGQDLIGLGIETADSYSAYALAGSAVWEAHDKTDPDPEPLAHNTVIPLLHTPPGWTLEPGSATTLDPGTRYVAKGYGGLVTHPVGFTLDALFGLPSGQVITNDDHDPGSSTTMALDEFHARAATSC
ncbi:hypothetical protein LX16_1688 [Stackebrandtia albiflava]|uniref:Uncharacterized protein n=1 Tax=Stackebrandtia albiflava TaxID=406432 RepID=A0A562VDN1_9ACTN|nr:hypothetical protein [Stackebrandtia albiflava]TWJ15968.1 hypothetical protein LX16_1688 [Stackebrandtia albiflava]